MRFLAVNNKPKKKKMTEPDHVIVGNQSIKWIRNISNSLIKQSSISFGGDTYNIFHCEMCKQQFSTAVDFNWYSDEEDYTCNSCWKKYSSEIQYTIYSNSELCNDLCFIVSKYLKRSSSKNRLKQIKGAICYLLISIQCGLF